MWSSEKAGKRVEVVEVGTQTTPGTSLAAISLACPCQNHNACVTSLGQDHQDGRSGTPGTFSTEHTEQSTTFRTASLACRIAVRVQMLDCATMKATVHRLGARNPVAVLRDLAPVPPLSPCYLPSADVQKGLGHF